MVAWNTAPKQQIIDLECAVKKPRIRESDLGLWILIKGMTKH